MFPRPCVCRWWWQIRSLREAATPVLGGLGICERRIAAALPGLEAAAGLIRYALLGLLGTELMEVSGELGLTASRAPADAPPCSGECFQVFVASAATDDDGSHNFELGQHVTVHRRVHSRMDYHVICFFCHSSPGWVARPELVFAQYLDKLCRSGGGKRIGFLVKSGDVVDLLVYCIASCRPVSA
jgi:hypothetical protein